MKKIIYKANDCLLLVALALIVAMMFATVGDVIGRFFGVPIPGVFEMSRYCLAVIVFASLGYSQINKIHIAIELLVSRFPAFLQHILDLVIYAVMTVLFALAFWQMLVYGGRLLSSGQFTTVLRFPVYPFVYISAFAVLFFVLVLVTDFTDTIGKLRKGGDRT